MSKPCRPYKMTCRWVKEISEAIENVCPAQPSVKHCFNPYAAWDAYYADLSKCTQCLTSPRVQGILTMETDYNEFRK